MEGNRGLRTPLREPHQSVIDVEEKTQFRVESHVFAGEEFESK